MLYLGFPVFIRQLTYLPLIAGPVPTVVTVLGGLGFLYLAVGRTRRWWILRLPAGVLVAVAAVAVVAFVVAVTGLFPDALPLRCCCGLRSR
jgi:hypothetical protein